MASRTSEMSKMARFFTKQAESNASVDRVALTYDIQAAITFGRSITFVLQKEFRHSDGFDDWYATKQEELAQCPIANFFNMSRNIILKEGPISVLKQIDVEITEGIAMTDIVQVKTVRGGPWYRRVWKWLWDDGAVPNFRRTRDRFIRWLSRRKRNSENSSSSARASERYHFDSEEFRDRSAFDLLDEYLNGLETVVEEAERRFG